MGASIWGKLGVSPLEGTIVLTALSAKYIHASPAPYALAAGILAHTPELYGAVRVVDATINQPPGEVLAGILSARPGVVGLSCYLWNIRATLALCVGLRAALPEVVLVLGGPEVSYCAEAVLEENPQIDYILAGEGEESLPALLSALFGTKVPEGTSIPGFWGREEDGTPYAGAPWAPIGAVPSPLSAGYAEAIGGRIAYFETSRGCPYSCAFCLSGGCGVARYFPLDAALKDLVALANSGTRTIKFVDRTFNANPRHANEILRFILAEYGGALPRGVCFHFEIAGDILQEETFALLARMPRGAVQLEIGLQSFHAETLAAVCRKTDTELLARNIRRLVAMGTMHIHIDLIAGLPQEGMAVFAESFNRGYGLGAQMLQLGFLKLLHGSAMRGNPERYPCTFDENPPYEVRETPWLTPSELERLHRTEDALERAHNSGRFSLTVCYVLQVSGLTAFAFYEGLGKATGALSTLDDYTALLQGYCGALGGVEPEILRDMLVRDRLAVNSTGRLPPCLMRQDGRLRAAVQGLCAASETAPQRGVRRGVALLYGAGTVCWADYAPEGRDPVSGRWSLRELPLAGGALCLSNE